MPSSFRNSVIQRAREIWDARPIFMDTETTGLHNSAEIVEICLIDHAGEVLLDALVRPRRPIPLDTMRIHGITNEMVAQSPTWLQIWPQVEELLRNRLVGMYNAEFDQRMLQQSHLANGLPWRTPTWQVFDIMKMYTDFSGAWKWQKLEDAGRQCRIPLPNSHRAKDDTLLTRALFEHMATSLP
ncbi:MAG: 3'-5' exonuclease [Chloroflexota bacterium]